MKRVIALVCAVLAFSALGMKAAEAEADVQVLSKQFDFKDFHGLSASNAFQVNLVQDTNYYVEVEYSDFLGEYLDVSVFGGTLRLGLKNLPRSVQNSRKYKEGTVLKATVHMPRLTSLNLSGSAKLEQEGRFHLSDEEFRMDLSGAAHAENLAVDAHKARLVTSGAAKCNGFEGEFYQVVLKVSGASKGLYSAEAEDWDVTLSGSAHVELKGEACKTMDIESSGASRADVSIPSETLQYEGSGASRLDALEAPANKAKIELSGSSSCHIAVKESLEVEASGASDCYYKAIGGAGLKTKFDISRGSRVRTL